MNQIVTRPLQTDTSIPPSEKTVHRREFEVDSNSKVQPQNVDEYVAIHKKPYLSSYLGLDMVFNIKSIAQSMQEVDDYVRSEIENRHLKNSFEAYAKIVDEVEASIGITPLAQGDHRLMVINRWIKHVIIPQRKIEQRRKELLSSA